MGAVPRFDQRDPIAFAPMIGKVAAELWGEPNRRLSKPGELRWGNQGARIVYPDTGAFLDTEADRRGGTLDLIEHVEGVDRAGAMAWLADRGLIPAAGSSRPVLPPTRQAAAGGDRHAVRLDRGQRIVASFGYQRDGVLLYRKHRIEPGRAGRSKGFAYDRPSPDGGWIAGRGHVEAPYRGDALDGADLIVMAEGEAKADKLAGWGYAATSHKDWSDDFAPLLRGKRVVILPDNDETGARLAAKVMDQVRAAGGHAIALDLPRLPDKGDVLDWDGDAAELAALIDGLGFPKPATFPIADLAAWSRTSAVPTPFYMAGHIPLGEVTLLTGAGGGNKSTFGQQLATCSAAGLAMLGVDVVHGPALYITAEDHEDRLHWMQEHICRALGADMAKLAGKLFLASIRGRLNNELATFDADGRLQPREAFQLVRSTIEATAARLLVLDNVAHLFAGNENDRAQVTAFINLLYVLCRELGVTILLIAHRNKAGDSYSGSTAWLNAVRSQLVIERPEGSPDPDARVMTIGKANYARPDQQLAFRWHDFALVLDSDLPDDRRAELAAAAAAGGDNAVFLACLDARTRDGLVVSPNVSPNYAPTQFEAMPAAKGIGRDRLRHAMERLLMLGTIEVFDHEKKGKGVSVKALRRAASPAPRTWPRTVPEPLPNASPHVPEQSSRTTPHTHLPPKGGTGAALKAAPPVPSTWNDNPALSRSHQPAALTHDPDDIEWPDRAEEHDHD